MHEIIQRDYAYSDGKLLEQWYREVNTQIRSIIEHINNTPQVVDWTPQLQQIVARLTTLESISPTDFSAEIQQIIARLDAIESANAQTQTDLSQIRTEIVEIQNMLASLVGTPVSPPATPPVAEFSGTVSLTSGIATFGQVIPEGQIPSGSYVKVGSLTTQNDIKTTWDDGSVRFVVLTCEPGSDGDYALSRDNTSQASAMTPPAIPSNTYVELDIGGSVYRATCPTTHSSDKWLEGSLCVESRFEVIPILVSDGTTEHGFLRVIFDVRSYSASEYRIDVTVENCLDESTAVLVTYDVDVVINNSSVYTKSSIAHAYLARWRKKFASGYTESKTDSDTTLMHTAGAIPKYDSNANSDTFTITGTDFDPMGTGPLTVPMNNVGGRAEIAPYPDWSAQYLVHKTSNQYTHMLLNGDLAGSWSVHCRKKSSEMTETGVGDMRFVSIAQEPNYWFSTGGSAGNKPAGDLASGTTYDGDVAHQPSLAYLPYLITGDRYYRDEMIYWANFCVLNAWPTSTGFPRSFNGWTGLLWQHQTRGIAWGLRNIVDAAAYCEDGCDEKAYLNDIIADNLALLDYMENNSLINAISGSSGPFNFNFARTFSGIKTVLSISNWQENFVAWAIDHAHKQGYTGGEDMRDNLIGWIVQMWNSADWPDEYVCASYINASSSANTADYYTTIDEIFHATYGDPPSGASNIAGGRGPDYRLAYMVAIEQGLSGAQAAYNYINPFMNADISTDLAFKAGWFIEEL